MVYKKNVGALDAVLRIGIGGAMIYAAFINTDLIDDRLAAALLGILGLVIFVSGLLRHCPLYNLIDFSSRKTD